MTDSRLEVALTGATGFVGRHVLTHLLQAGHHVRALVRDRSRLQPGDGRLRVVEGDLFNDAALGELTKGAHAVVHLVGIINEAASKGQTFECIHVEGTRRLLGAAKNANVRRWIHMSALGTRPDAHSRYHQTKWDAEQLVRRSGIEYAIFRPSIIHGPDGEFMQLVRDFWCKRFPPFVPYFGKGLFGRGGAGRLQPVWVEDVARCFAAAVTNEQAANETYPMGGPDAFTWPQLYLAVKQHLPNARNKRIVPVPAWYAKMIADFPGVPFNQDQVIMSQEDSTCEISKVQQHFQFELLAFDTALTEYASQL